MGRRGLIGVIAVAALILGVCGGDDDSNGDGTDDSSTSQHEVSIVSQNILHGISCAPDSDHCAIPARVELFLQQLDDADCPDVVGLQEANQEVADLVSARLPDTCDGAYELQYDGDPGVDRELVLTTGQVLGFRRDRLAGPLRTVSVARIATDAGLLDFVTTHLASGSDDRPCDPATCPPPCLPEDMVNTCQAREVLQLVDEISDPDVITVVGGDLNATIDDPTNVAFLDAGFVDTHTAAGNAECDPQTGEQCTSGREDQDLSDMTDPASLQDERIDFLWLDPSRGCDVVAPTGLFNAEPAIDGPAGLAFPSDHTAVQATLSCPTTEAHLDATITATLPTTSSQQGDGSDSPNAGEPAGGEPDAATAEEITTAYESLFGGEVTDLETKLGYLQDGEALRQSLERSFQANQDVTSRIRVRIDDITLNDATNATVTYTLLLDGSPVLDQLPGAAVQQDHRWLVTRRTYCDVATTGADEIPEPCRE